MNQQPDSSRFVGADAATIATSAPHPGVLIEDWSFSVRAAAKGGWRVYTRRFRLMVLASALPIVTLAAGLAAIDAGEETLMDKGRWDLAALWGLCYSLATLIVAALFSVGVAWLSARAARGETASLRNLIDPLRQLTALVPLVVLFALIQIVVQAALLSVILVYADQLSANGTAVAFLAALTSVPLLAAYVRTLPACLLVVDPQARDSGTIGARRAISMSWEMTSGLTLRLLAIWTITVLAALACTTAAVVGLHLLMPAKAGYEHWVALVIAWVLWLPFVLCVCGVAYSMLLHRAKAKRVTEILLP